MAKLRISGRRFRTQSDLAQDVTRDPYQFGFLSLTRPFAERDIERQLVANVRELLLEMGKGFAFVGSQVHLRVHDEDYYLDLLFYHVRLHCFVVVELKEGPFKPEHAGKLNFYLSAVDDLLRAPEDNPTIGLLLCRSNATSKSNTRCEAFKSPWVLPSGRRALQNSYRIV